MELALLAVVAVVDNKDIAGDAVDRAEAPVTIAPRDRS